MPTEDLGNPFLALAHFLPTEDLGDPFLPILCLLKILASQWQPVLAVFVLVSFQFPKIIVLVMFQKSSCEELGTDETRLI